MIGTEAMTEVFIDSVDCYGMAVTWGPYKQYTYASPKNYFSEGGFGGWEGWVFYGKCMEIPMFQYVYNPVMPLKLAGHGNLSGGTGPNADETSAHNIGQCFYWLVAKSYLSGFVIRIDYDLVPVDILSSMDKKADTYMLDWNRPMEDPEKPLNVPEVLPEGTTDWHYWIPKPGRHPYRHFPFPERHKEFNKHQRTYGDPQKEQFLRMMAYMRSHLIPEFLVYGEMMRPGKIVSEENKKIDYDYEYYWSFGDTNHPIFQKPIAYEDVYAAQLEHQGNWSTKPIITSAWHEANPDNLQIIGHVQLPNALYIVANTSNVARNLKYSFECDLYPKDTLLRVFVLRLRPGSSHQSSWSDWQMLDEPLRSIDGIVSWEREGKLFSHEIMLIKLEPMGKKEK
ncbi:MAG: hypothetical protein GX444_09785 [Myxococcales bacterium]|nr:hypothetical protein [Myxococcales bacterium]